MTYRCIYAILLNLRVVTLDIHTYKKCEVHIAKAESYYYGIHIFRLWCGSFTGLPNHLVT